MAEPTDLVVIGDDGGIRVAGRGAERRLRDRAGRYHLVVEAPGLVIFRGEVEPDGEAKPVRVAMAGELLNKTSCLEVINIIATANWRGDLHVMDGEHHRVLAIQQGALRYALSDSPDDRLGQVLYRHGVLSRRELDAVLRDVTPEKRLGQLLIERQLVSQEQLFAQLRKQVEQIFYAALLTRSGYYAFSVSDDDDHVPHHTVHLPIHQLLMEGVQRIDEMALFRQRIPHDELCPVAQPKVTQLSLDENMQLVLTYADGERTVEDIARETGLGRFETIKSLYGMVQRGGVVLRERQQIDDAAVKRLVRQFNDVLRDVFMAVATYGAIDQTRSTLEAWVEGSGYDAVFGKRVLDEDGSISTSAVIEAMQSLQSDAPMEMLAQALHELAAFALFAATTTLPRDQELSLSRDVNARLKRIRL